MKKATLAIMALAGLGVVAGTAMAAEPYLPRMQKLFDRIDANKDGKVTSTELEPIAAKRFMKEDANGDGSVSSAEIDAALKIAMEKRRDRILATMDTNKDGSISKAELDGFVEAMVKGADANADGGVSLDEARSFKLAKWRKTLQSGSVN